MTREQLAREAVETLLALGWRWEGRALVPAWKPGDPEPPRPLINEASQAYREAIRNNLHSKGKL